jgi:hypothetical protein
MAVAEEEDPVLAWLLRVLPSKEELESLFDEPEDDNLEMEP